MEIWTQIHTHGGEGHVMKQAENGVMLPQAKEHQVLPEPLEARRRRERKGPSLETSERAWSC